MNENEIICRQLCQSIDVVMDEKSGVLERNSANQLMDQFKYNHNVLVLYDIIHAKQNLFS